MITGILEILVEDVTVEAKVGRDTNAKVKVYPVRYPQKEGANAGVAEKYYIVYKTPGSVVHGKGCSSMQSNFNVHCCATNYSDADEMFKIVMDVLNHNDQITTTDAGIRFNGIWYVSDYDTYDENAKRFTRVVSFSCHNEYI